MPCDKDFDPSDSMASLRTVPPQQFSPADHRGASLAEPEKGGQAGDYLREESH
jgi:hypothetical protein